MEFGIDGGNIYSAIDGEDDGGDIVDWEQQEEEREERCYEERREHRRKRDIHRDDKEHRRAAAESCCYWGDDDAKEAVPRGKAPDDGGERYSKAEEELDGDRGRCDGRAATALGDERDVVVVADDEGADWANDCCRAGEEGDVDCGDEGGGENGCWRRL